MNSDSYRGNETSTDGSGNSTSRWPLFLLLHECKNPHRHIQHISMTTNMYQQIQCARISVSLKCDKKIKSRLVQKKTAETNIFVH